MVILMLTSSINAQKAPIPQSFEINPDKFEDYYHKDNMRMSSRTDLPLAIYNANYPVDAASPETMAEQYLRENQNLLGLAYSDLRDLKHHATRTSESGHVVRYRQQKGNRPVNKAEITININLENKVMYVMNGYRKGVKISSLTPTFPLDQAKTLAHNHINSRGKLSYENSHILVYTNDSQTRLAYEIAILSEEPLGEWHVWVDAHTGEIFKAVDEASYYCSHDHKKDECKNKVTEHTCSHNHKASAPMKIQVNGTGDIFNPDPLSSATTTYGTGGYSDNNDATNTDLQSQIFNVTLLDIEEIGGTYKLKGPYAEVTDWDNPSTGLFTQTSPDFIFNRNEQGFEATNAYYHIDYAMRYINETLGCDIMPHQYSGGVQYDPHGAGGADNSYYTPGTGRLSFGEGCVDDAEDSDVVHHELGHGIHDWATSGNASAAEGLGEGSGDYWAQSYNRGLGYWSPSDPQYNRMFNWDGHNQCWPGRITNYGATYPGGLTGGIHQDGQIWASCLMGIWDEIGQAQTDKMFLEGLAMTNGGSGQNDAANAAFQAAQNMNYSLEDLTIIYNSLTACGYTLPSFNTPPIVEFSADAQIVCLDDGGMVNFTDLSTGSPTSYAWTFPGGTPATSTDANPTVTYSATGTYDVTLTATNSFGTDTETYTAYINVVSGADCPSCILISSTNVPVSISSNGTPTVTSVLEITDSGQITDLNVLNLMGDHTWISDLTISLTSPAGTTVTLFSEICDDEDDFNINFDDEAGAGALPCPPVGGGTYQPTGTLEDFNNESPTGTWTLTIEDGANDDGGNLTAWTLEICLSDCTPPVTSSINGADNPEVNTTESYEVTANTGSTYSWTITGGSQTAGSNTASIEVEWGSGTTGEICVIETGAGGCLGEEVCLSIDLLPSNIEEVTAIKNLQVFPNPTSGLLQIESNEIPLSIQVYDVIGKHIKNVNGITLSNSVDLSELANGIYIIQVQFEDGFATKRILLGK